MATEYTVTYKLGAARQDGVEVDVSIARDDGLPILGSVGTRRVFPLSTEALAAVKDAKALDELVRKEAESWGVPVADGVARAALAEAQAALDKATLLDAKLATTGRAVALTEKAVEEVK